jgi:hypothetical protein
MNDLKHTPFHAWKRCSGYPFQVRASRIIATLAGLFTAIRAICWFYCILETKKDAIFPKDGILTIKLREIIV